MVLISFDHIFKLVVAGDKGVGKTALIQNFCSKFFEKDMKMKIGVDFFIKDMIIKKLGTVRLQIWDFITEKTLQYLNKSYMKGANGVMFLYSITDKSTLDSLDEWLPVFRNDDPYIPIMLVGTKLDLENERSVLKEESIKFGKSRGCAGVLEISTKENINIEQIFENMAILMWEKYNSN